jgi:hypothetical protein
VGGADQVRAAIHNIENILGRNNGQLMPFKSITMRKSPDLTTHP